jgi:Flp pilus assembly protein TadG
MQRFLLATRASQATTRLDEARPRRPGAAKRRQTATRRAASALEFAVVAPLFFLLIFGLVEFGRCLMVQHLLTNAARQGCRVAVIEGKTTADVTTTVNNLLSGQGINGATTTVQVNGATADASTAGAGDQINVSVSIPAGATSWVPQAQFCLGTITGTYALRRE